jgi:hypothetical protein
MNGEVYKIFLLSLICICPVQAPVNVLYILALVCIYSYISDVGGAENSPIIIEP